MKKRIDEMTNEEYRVYKLEEAQRRLDKWLSKKDSGTEFSKSNMLKNLIKKYEEEVKKYSK